MILSALIAWGFIFREATALGEGFRVNSRVDVHHLSIKPKAFYRNDGDYATVAVATEHPECSKIGKEMLLAGGSAVDSAISAALCIGIINNFSSGIGGGGFMLIRTGYGQSTVLNFREAAPAASTEGMFEHAPQDAKRGYRSIAIPGEIRGFEAAHAKYGRLSWSQLFAPNIALARNGFPVTQKLASMLDKFQDQLRESPGMIETYFKEDGHTPKGFGELIQRPNLANTLETIANEGANAFYQGAIARALVKDIAAHGGIATMDDFKDYDVVESAAETINFRGYEIITASAPTSGPAALVGLKVLSELLDRPGEFEFDTDGMLKWAEMSTSQRAKFTHYLIEALKFAYATRMKLADPRFAKMGEIIWKGLKDAIIQRKAGAVKPNKTFPPGHYTEIGEEVADKGTMHLNVYDHRDGMAVSFTSTINLEFGSKIMNRETGIIYNNEMDDFSIPGKPNEFQLPPSRVNFPKGRKRPQSSSTPMIALKDGQVVLIIGGTGGSRIIASTMQAAVGILVQGLSAATAVSMARFHHQLIPNELIVEHEYPGELEQLLANRGHQVHRLRRGLYFSGVSAITVARDASCDSTVITAVSDPRKGGSTDGF